MIIFTTNDTKWKENGIRYGKEERNMKTWFGVLMSAMLNYPLLYPGYLVPEEKQKLEITKVGLSVSWILLFICICVLVLVFILFWKDARSHNKRKEIAHQ